jgi:phytoene dehydrogenase-like protein
MIIERFATYAGADPRRAPAALAVAGYVEHAFGAWHVRGGIHRLVSALEQRLAELGGELHHGQRVDALLLDGRRVTGVGSAAGHVGADAVVWSADALALERLLGRASQPAPERSLSGFALMLGLRGRTDALVHHRIEFPADYDAEFDDVFGRPERGVPARPANDPAVFVTVADDPLVRPPDHEAWSILVNAPPHGDNAASVDWTLPDVADRYADRILDVLAGRGVDVRNRILFRELRTPADLQRSTASPGGAIYGTPAHGLAGLRRPGNRATTRGLFLVGGSVHPGGGLPMVMLSAKIVASQIGPA